MCNHNDLPKSIHIPPCSSTVRFDCCLFLLNATNATTIIAHITIRTTDMIAETAIAIVISEKSQLLKLK